VDVSLGLGNALETNALSEKGIVYWNELQKAGSLGSVLPRRQKRFVR